MFTILIGILKFNIEFVSQLFEVVQDGHMIWSCPLSMLIVMILLIYVQGPVTIVGMAVLILMVPLVKIIVSKTQKAR